MSMRLTADNLRTIADRLDKLSEIDVEVTRFKVHGHTVVVKKASDQRDGDNYLVIGLSDRDIPDTITRDR